MKVELCPSCGSYLLYKRDSQGVLWVLCTRCKYAKQLEDKVTEDWKPLGAEEQRHGIKRYP